MTNAEPARSRVVCRHTSLVPLLLATGFGVFIGTFDQTVVVTILPDMIRDLNLPVARFGEAVWIVNGYLLGYTVAMPLVGRLADVYGYLRLYLIALGIFLLGSAGVALAPNLALLVAARSFQAIGGGGVLPVAMAIASGVLPPRRRPLALGSLAATNNASSLLGPLWGAVLVGLVGWRGVFWLNIPLTLPVMLLLPRLAHETPRHGTSRIDWPGAAFLTIALSMATVALTDDGANPRPLFLSIAFGAVALFSFVFFLWRERRCAEPMIELRAIHRLRFAGAMVMYFLIGGALITALVDIPLMTNTLLGGSSLQGGLNLMRLLLFLPIGGVVGGQLAGWSGYRILALLGLLAAATGFLLMKNWPALPSSGQLWLSLGLVGFGLGLCDAPIVATVIASVTSHARATASALLIVAWTSGMIVGLALLGTQGLGSFDTRAARLFREQGVNLQASTIQHLMRQTFNATFLAAAAALALALLLAPLLEGRGDRSFRWSPLAGLED